MTWRIIDLTRGYDFGRDYELWQARIVIARHRVLYPKRRYQMQRTEHDRRPRIRHARAARQA